MSTKGQQIGVETDMEKAKDWYKKAALQDHNLAIAKCKELGIPAR